MAENEFKTWRVFTIRTHNNDTKGLEKELKWVDRKMREELLEEGGEVISVAVALAPGAMSYEVFYYCKKIEQK